MLGNLEDIQKISKDNIDGMTRSFGVMPKAVQAMAAEMASFICAGVRPARPISVNRLTCRR